jgi:LCP family protein required for cell wall assembly
VTTIWQRAFIVSLVIVGTAVVGLGVAAWAALHQIERLSYDLEGARDRLGVPPEYAPRPGSDGVRRAERRADAAGEPWPEHDGRPDERDDALEVFLLVGVDAEAADGGSRADVIMLAILPTEGGEPVLVSLPRDLWIEDLCRGGEQRINVALLGCGTQATGQELMLLTVEQFTGLPVDHYAEVDFDGFASVIDLIGGLEICTEHAVRDAKSGLAMPAGCVDADGEQALAWVRSRQTEERVDGVWRQMEAVDDLTRNARQQEVLLDAAEQVAATRSPRRVRALAARAAEEVALGESLSSERLARLMWRWRDTDRDDVRRVSLEVEHHTTEGGAAVLLPVRPFGEVLEELGVDPDAPGGAEAR